MRSFINPLRRAREPRRAQKPDFIDQRRSGRQATSRIAIGFLGVVLASGALASSATATAAESAATVAAPMSVATVGSVAVARVLPAAAPSARVLAARAVATRARYMNNVRSRIVRIARSRLGMTYSAGAAGPRRFDCSGFAMYVWRHGAHRSLPHSSREQFNKLRAVKLSALRPGDLLFYFKGGVHHVAVYVGHGRMIHAANPRDDILNSSINDRWYRKHFSGARRLF